MFRHDTPHRQKSFSGGTISCDRGLVDTDLIANSNRSIAPGLRDPRYQHHSEEVLERISIGPIWKCRFTSFCESLSQLPGLRVPRWHDTPGTSFSPYLIIVIVAARLNKQVIELVWIER